MFETYVYVKRRKLLKEQLKSGIILLPGNVESPMNYPAKSKKNVPGKVFFIVS